MRTTYSNLQGCPHCKENAVVIKCYDNPQGERSRVEYCVNKGCGYSKDLPFPEQIERSRR